MSILKSFASDNNAGIHPKIMEAIMKANAGQASSYGTDEYSKRAVDLFKKHFGDEIDVYFVFNGTGANVLGLKAMTKSTDSIICAETAHLNVDECGGPEYFTGCKVIALPTDNGKITPEQIKQRLIRFGDQHFSQPKVISITQTTEYGTLYTLEEIQEIARLAHEHGMLLHMDGSRLSNAAASLGLSFKEFTVDAGVDVLSFGGTKNGLMIGEAVVFFNKDLAADFKYIRKQGMQLGSKLRFIAAQFEALLTDELWLENARNANEMARKLGRWLEGNPLIQITQKVESNSIFAIIPKEYISVLHEKFIFNVWNAEKSEVRLMTAFDTSEEDIKLFADEIDRISTIKID
jgi:threonine aldolase